MANIPLKLEKVASYLGHKDAVFCLDYNPHSNQLLSGAGDGLLVSWYPNEHEDGKLIAQMPKPIWSMLSNPSLNQVFAGTSDGHIYIVDLDKKNENRCIIAHEKGVFSIKAHSLFFVSGGGDGVLVFWSHQWDIIRSVQVSNKSIRDIQFCPNAKTIFVACSDGAVYRYDMEGNLLATFPIHQLSVFSIVIWNDYFCTGGRDASIKVWNYKTNTEVKHIPAHWFHVHSLALSPDNMYLASSSMDKSIKIWDANSFELLKVISLPKIEAHTNCVNKILWINANEVISCGDDKQILHFKILT